MEYSFNNLYIYYVSKIFSQVKSQLIERFNCDYESSSINVKHHITTKTVIL